MTSVTNLPGRPLVSVIVPCYNQAEFLREAVDSALSQTYPHREVVVIDDGSDDDTAGIAASYGQQVRVVRQPNAGLPTARNHGIAVSRGDIIGLLDADDRWLPNHLETKVALFADPDIGAVHGSYRKFPAELPGAGITRKVAGAESDFHDVLTRNALGAPVSVLFRRAAFDAAGGFDPACRWGAEDWDLWIRIAARARIVATGEVSAEYRLRPDSMSRNYDRMYRALRLVVDRNQSHHVDCRQCRMALRRARRNIRSYYRDAATRDALRAWQTGRRVESIALRLRGMLRDPAGAARRLPAAAQRVWSTR
jgi:glycosyltransferase involved in cell wall biosynthesis